MHRLTPWDPAWGRWAVEFLQCGGPLAWGTRSRAQLRSLLKERNSCNALPHYLGAVGSVTHVMLCRTAQG